MSTGRRTAAAAVALAVLLGVAGCASIPESSPVQVLRTVDGQLPAPPGPVDGSNPPDMVRSFVEASGSSTNDHAAARRFLAPEVQGWDDGDGLVVIEQQFDTVYRSEIPGPGVDVAEVRIRGTGIGRITASGSFEPDPSRVEVDVGVVRRDGQWRISRLPDGVVVRQADFRTNYRTVRTYFVDPVHRSVVADLRYLAATPAQALASGAVDLLLAGPSGALLGAVVSQLPQTARLRSNVAEAPDGTVVVDLTEIGDLDEQGRKLLAAQVVLSLAEVGVGRVRLLVDGEPLLPGWPDLIRNDVAGLGAEIQPGADVPGLVVTGGRVSQLTGPESGAALPGPLGNGGFAVESVASSVDGTRIAAVTRQAGARRLLLGGTADVELEQVDLDAATMTRPSWTPSGGEVWTVLNSMVVARVLDDDDAGPARTGQVNSAELAALGPIQDLRLSRDGLRIVAVVGGRLYTAAVARSIDGEVAIRNIRQVRAADFDEVVAADWRAADSIVVVSRHLERPIAVVSADGFSLEGVPSSNLTPPLRAVAAAPSRPLLVGDEGGVWSFAGGERDTWRQVVGGVPDAVPVYPG